MRSLIFYASIIAISSSTVAGQENSDDFYVRWQQYRDLQASNLNRNNEAIKDLQNAQLEKAREAQEKAQEAALNAMKDAAKGIPSALRGNKEKAVSQALDALKDIKEAGDQQEALLAATAESAKVTELQAQNETIRQNIALTEQYIQIQLNAPTTQSHAKQAEQLVSKTNAFLDAARKAGERRERAKEDARRAEHEKREQEKRQQEKQAQSGGGESSGEAREGKAAREGHEPKSEPKSEPKAEPKEPKAEPKAEPKEPKEHPSVDIGRPPA